MVLSHCNPSILSKALYLGSVILIPIFFICAGYTTLANYSLKSKAKKLLIPYFVLNCLFLIIFHKDADIYSYIGVFYSRYSLYPLSSPECNNIFFLNVFNAPMWFFTAMFTAYIFYKPFIYLRGFKAYILLFIYLSISYLTKYIPILLPWSIDTAFLFATYMYVGKFIRENNLISNRLIILPFLLLYLISVIIPIPINLSVRIFGNNLLQYVCIFTGAFSGCYILMRLSYLFEQINSKFIRFISNNALIIFSVQIPFIEIGAFLGQFFHLPQISIAIIQLLLVFLGGGAIGVAYNYVKTSIVNFITPK